MWQAEHARWAHKSLRRLRRIEEVEEEMESHSAKKREADQDDASVMTATSSTVACTAAAPAEASGADERASGRPCKKRKNKGFLAPGGSIDAAMGEQEREVTRALRANLRVADGQCPSLAELKERLADVLHTLHR